LLIFLTYVYHDARFKECKVTEMSVIIYPMVQYDCFTLRMKALQSFTIFYILLTVHLVTNSCYDQLDALFHLFIYLFHLSKHFEHHMLIIRRSNVLIHHLVWLVCVSNCLVCQSGGHTKQSHRLIIPDDVLIQLNLLMMSMWCSKHVQRWNKYTKKCVMLVTSKNL